MANYWPGCIAPGSAFGIPCPSRRLTKSIHR
jgi:hypothetical protein